MGETTGSAWIGACCDAVVGGIVDVTTDPDCRGVVYRDAFVGGTVDVTTGPYHGEACCDAVLGGTVGVTTSLYRGEACCDAILGGTVGVTTSPYHGEACCDTILGGTVGVTTSPFHHIFDIVGITTDSFVAILRCDATMLILDGDIVGKTTNSLIMSLNSPWRWAIMHCVGSMPW